MFFRAQNTLMSQKHSRMGTQSWSKGKGDPQIPLGGQRSLLTGVPSGCGCLQNRCKTHTHIPPHARTHMQKLCVFHLVPPSLSFLTMVRDPFNYIRREATHPLGSVFLVSSAFHSTHIGVSSHLPSRNTFVTIRRCTKSWTIELANI